MGSFSITHWLIFLAVVAIVFGTSKLKNIGKDVGGAVKDFKDAVKDETKEQINKANRIIDHQETEVIDESVKSKKENNT